MIFQERETAIKEIEREKVETLTKNMCNEKPKLRAKEREGEGE